MIETLFKVLPFGLIFSAAMGSVIALLTVFLEKRTQSRKKRIRRVVSIEARDLAREYVKSVPEFRSTKIERASHIPPILDEKRGREFLEVVISAQGKAREVEKGQRASQWAVAQKGSVSYKAFISTAFNRSFNVRKAITTECEKLGIQAIRQDQIFKSEGASYFSLIDAIRSSDLVIADIDGLRPNVIYEVGIAHALGKPTILLDRNSDPIPQELSSLRVITYSDSNTLGKNLESALLELPGVSKKAGR